MATRYRHPSQVVLTLADGPLEGQELKVHTQRGGALPVLIFPHAPLQPGHLDEPGPRHAYHLAVDGVYRHCQRCVCRLPLAG